jgi:hypothetical protein
MNRMNIYAIDTETSKPTIIKSWELASYVRVEFETPINEEFLEKFPYGISKNAGDEYYSPYILIINKMPFPGSSNKQIYILGQDPYGFDIAVKNNSSYDGTLIKDVELYPDPYIQTSINPFFTYHMTAWGSESTSLDLERDELINLSEPNFLSHANHQLPISGSSGYTWYSGDWYDFSFDWRNIGKLIAGIWDAETQGFDPSAWFIEDELDEDGLPIWNWESEKGFNPSLLNFFRENFREGWNNAFNQRWILQHPNLLEEDIWKLDQTGKSQYGIMTPPQKYNVTMPDGSKIQSQEDWNPDRNFAAQFIVVGSGSDTSRCLEYSCANPEGSVSSSGCPENYPWCNCPNQELIPKGSTGSCCGSFGCEENYTSKQCSDVNGVYRGATATKPTPTELSNLLNEARHCNLITEHLGEDWLGCIWSDLENPDSCACPGIGENFHKYIEYIRTYSTYWSTPNYAPLYRNAQMNLIQSQKAHAVVSGNLSLRPGDLIEIDNSIPLILKYNQKSSAGVWMIESISHLIEPNNHEMSLKLIRDSIPINPEDFGIINRILKALL